MTCTLSLPFWRSVVLTVVLVLAAGPSAAAAVAMLGPDCCEDHTAPPATPEDAPACCAPAPAVPNEAATVPPVSAQDGVPAVRVAATAGPAPVRLPEPVLPRDTGPPPGPRRHLALSVLLV